MTPTLDAMTPVKITATAALATTATTHCWATENSDKAICADRVGFLAGCEDVYEGSCSDEWDAICGSGGYGGYGGH